MQGLGATLIPQGTPMKTGRMDPTPQGVWVPAGAYPAPSEASKYYFVRDWHPVDIARCVVQREQKGDVVENVYPFCMHREMGNHEVGDAAMRTLHVTLRWLCWKCHPAS